MVRAYYFYNLLKTHHHHHHYHQSFLKLLPYYSITLLPDLPAGVYILEVKDQLDPRVLHTTTDGNSEITALPTATATATATATSTSTGPGEMKGGMKVIRPIPVNKEIKINVLARA